MIINRCIREHLYRLDMIHNSNRRKYPRHTAYMLYQIMLDFMRYWRHLELTEFDGMSEDAQDEIYYFFTEQLLHIHDAYLDFYWLIGDLDDQPLFKNGRKPAGFWRKKLDRPEYTLKRFPFLEA